MTYGISVKNDIGRIILEADYPLFRPTSSTASTTSSYPTGLYTGDLVVGRPPVGTSGGPFRYDTSPSSYDYYILRQSSTITAPTTGYGMVVKGDAGQTIFSASNQEKLFLVAAAGVLSPTGDMGARFPVTGSVTDLDKYYVVVNNTLINITATMFGVSGVISGYLYAWESGTTGYIGVTNSTFYGLNPAESRPYPFSYMILKEVG